VIGVRSFGSEPLVVGRHVAAAVRGLQRAGVAACLKHFPGHGASRSDSHHEVATVDRDAGELQAVELEPFRAGIAAGARAVMTGHLLVPALDPSALATVSRPVSTELLRAELGFTGTVVTDALEMQAVSGTVGMVEGFVQALGAGADAIETGARDYPEFPGQVCAAVADALASGRVHQDRLSDAARRTADLATPGAAAVEVDSGLLGQVPARCLEASGALPMLQVPLVVECRPPGGMASGELPWSLAEPLARLVPGTQARPVRTAADTAGLEECARGRSLVVVVRDPARHGWQGDVLAVAQEHPNAVVVDAGWPTESLPPPWLRTRGIAPGLLRAAAELLADRGR
jgi:beta-N-acetylhexosaminidase